ncbi:hypothetical protein SDC9_176448 [bioreactor metagenome]|uniref:Uncharacterized protein n=1 Tax=bioreactor metagenome TaxID=1076179 RepID=A0A645GRV5_9ZZZZ
MPAGGVLYGDDHIEFVRDAYRSENVVGSVSMDSTRNLTAQEGK